LAGLASMGMPGFSGFPAELTILIGTWKTSPLWAAFAATGVLVAAAFTLRVMQVAFFGSTETRPAAANVHEGGHHGLETCPPITWAERSGAMILIAATVYIGLKPDVLLQWISPALESPMMHATLAGGMP